MPTSGEAHARRILASSSHRRKAVSTVRRRKSRFLGRSAYYASGFTRTCVCELVYISKAARCCYNAAGVPDGRSPNGYIHNSILLRCPLILNTALELFNLLINPVSHDFALRWHRDDIREDATPEQEEEALKIWHHGVGSILMDLYLKNTI